MTNDQSHRDLPHFHDFPPGNAPKIHNHLHAANLHQTPSPLPTQKPEKGSAAAADFLGFPLSALGFQNTTFDLRLGNANQFPALPKRKHYQNPQPIASRQLTPSPFPASQPKIRKGKRHAASFHPSSFILHPSSFIPYLFSLIL
jgi:hypothetical protein